MRYFEIVVIFVQDGVPKELYFYFTTPYAAYSEFRKQYPTADYVGYTYR